MPQSRSDRTGPLPRRHPRARRAYLGATVAGLLIVLWPPSASGATPGASSPKGEAITYSTMTMGTYGNVTVVTADSAATDPVARIGLRAFTVVDSLMSNWSATSEISRLNRVAADGATAHPDVAEVLGVAREVWAGSGGAFDPTVEPLVRLWGFLGGVPEVPDSAAIEAVLARVGFEHVSVRGDEVRYADPQVRVDLGGIAKGYGVDRAVAALREAGVENAMVDISGNLRVLGSPPGRDRWTVGIRDPRDRVSFFARLPISEEAVATSGTYEQFVSRDGKVYGHILDPRTGWPAEGLISVTVVTATGIQADAWGTALFVMGAAKARALVAHRDDLEAILVEPGDGDHTPDVVWVSAGLADRLALEKGMDRWFEIRSF